MAYNWICVVEQLSCLYTNLKLQSVRK